MQSSSMWNGECTVRRGVLHPLAALTLSLPACRMYAFDVHCNSYFPLFLLLYGELINR